LRTIDPLSHASNVSRIAHEWSTHPHALGERWWEHLDPAFAEHEEPFALTPKDRLQIGAAAASDVVLRTLGAALVGAFALPLGYNPVALSRSLRDLRFYGGLAERGDAGAFFRPPGGPVPMLRRSADHPLFQPDDGTCEDVRFESPFSPVNPAMREAYLRKRKNRFAHARH
jgi:hypothetical protein